jgi:hypothetical protein
VRSRLWITLYELVLALGLSAMVLYAVGDSVIPDLLTEAERRGYSTGWVAVSLLFLVLGLWVRAWYFAGPLAASVGRFQWLMACHHPSRWLRRGRAVVLVVGALVSAVVAVLSGLAFQAAGDPYVVPALAVWVALQLLLLITLRLQRRDLDGVARLVPLVLMSTGVVLAVGEAWNGPVAVIAWGCLLLGLVGLVGLVGLAVARSGAGLTPRWQLHRGASGRWSVGAGITMLDHEIVRVVRQRQARASRRPLPAFVYRIRWPAGLAAVVLARDLRTVGPAIGLVLPLIFAIDRMLGPLPALLATTLLELFVTVAMGRSAEAWLTSNALPRMWAATGARIPVMLSLPGLAVCAVIAATVSLGASLPPLVALMLVALPGAIAARRRSIRSAAAESALLSTPFGAVSLHIVNRVIAGPDMALLTLLVANQLM